MTDKLMPIFCSPWCSMFSPFWLIGVHAHYGKQDAYRALFALVRLHTRATVPAGHTHCGAMGTVAAVRWAALVLVPQPGLLE